MGDGSVNAEMKTSLNLELLDFVSNVLNHFVQLVKMLFMKFDDVGEEISLLLLGLNCSLLFGNLHCVVCGQHECGSGGNEPGDVPLSSLTFRNVRKACKKVLEEFENLTDVGFVQFKSAV